MKTHELKTLPEYYKAVLDGTKTFEVRVDDRKFAVGDVLVLREYGRYVQYPNGPRATGCYSGCEVRKRVTYILRGGQFGIAPGTVVMGLADTDTETATP